MFLFFLVLKYPLFTLFYILFHFLSSLTSSSIYFFTFHFSCHLCLSLSGLNSRRGNISFYELIEQDPLL